MIWTSSRTTLFALVPKQGHRYSLIYVLFLLQVKTVDHSLFLFQYYFRMNKSVMMVRIKHALNLFILLNHCYLLVDS